jgi:hypothetical protein
VQASRSRDRRWSGNRAVVGGARQSADALRREGIQGPVGDRQGGRGDFSKGDWLELGLVTDAQDAIRGHNRLLRSLSWGDPDYSGNVLDVLPEVLGAGRRAAVKGLAVDVFPNLRDVEEHLGLQAWLAEHEPGLHRELYAGEDAAALDELDEAAARLGIPDIDMHAVRIPRGLHDDPAHAVGSAKELLETTLKAILGLHGTGPETKLDIPKLVKRTNIALGLDAAAMDGGAPGDEQRRKLLARSRRSSTLAPRCATPGWAPGTGRAAGRSSTSPPRVCRGRRRRRLVLRRGLRFAKSARVWTGLAALMGAPGWTTSRRAQATSPPWRCQRL